MTYAIRAIDLTLQLGTGDFGAAGYNTLTLSGLRVNAQISNVILPGSGTAIIQVWGLTKSQINQMAVAGLQWATRNNAVMLSAGDQTNAGMSPVFSGNIIEAYPDFTAAPDTAFVISATTNGQLQMIPVKPGTFQGTADVATIMGQMAQQAGLKFENNGVDVKLSNPYFPGTIIDQIYSCAKAANIFAYIEPAPATLVIMPKTGSRSGSVPIVSPATGMIGYPVFQQSGIVVRTIFNPTIKFGAQIQVETELTPARGKWTIYHMDYLLSSQMVDGPWEQVMTCYNGQK